MGREHRDLAHEYVVDLLLRLAHGSSGGDHLRPDRFTIQLPRAQLIDRTLVETHHGSQGTADQVELVLDDQIRRPHRRDSLDRRNRPTRDSPVAGIAIRARPEQSMPGTLLRYPTEQVPYRTTPRHHGELVHRGNHHRWWAVIHFLIHDHHRQTRVCLLARTAAREVASAKLVATVDRRTPSYLVDLNVSARIYLGSAPRAACQLCRRSHSGRVSSRGANGLNELVAILRSTWRHLVTDPKADGECALAKGLVARGQSFPTNMLHRADQRGSSLELLQSQQTQGVTHDHCQPARRIVAPQVSL
ncbi:hypothetical protein D3C84_508070 [compost metagenome]